MKVAHTVTLFKRHRTCTAADHLPVAQRRFYWNCSCQIWMVGRTPYGDEVPRQTTQCSDLKAAEAVLQSVLDESRNRSQSSAVHGPTIAECVRKYLASRSVDLCTRTEGHYKLLLERLIVFCDRQGVIYMTALTVDLLETFKLEGLPVDLRDTTRATAVRKLRKFLRDAHRRGWIKEALSERITSHYSVHESKQPLTDEEVNRVLMQSSRLAKTHGLGYAKYPATFRLLLELMLETGLRVGDAIRFDTSRLTKGERLWIYTFCPQKRKKTAKAKYIHAYISDRLKVAIDTCSWLSPGKPFEFGTFSRPTYLATQVYDRMQTIGKRCGVEDCRPHRLRDTFAVRLLLRGVPLEDVSRLLGHSSIQVTETYYAPWTAARKQRLERTIIESLVNA